MRKTVVVAALLAWTGSAHADVTRAQCVDTYEKSQVLRRDGKLRAAREALLVCSQKTCPAVTINDCARWLAEVEALTPTVSIAVRDRKGADLDALLTLDGASLANPGQTSSIDPGSHHLHATTKDGREADLDFVARAGEQNRLVTLTVPDAVKPVVGPPSDTPAPKEPAVETGPSVVPPVALTAVGAIGLGIAIGFGLHGKSEADDARAQCAPYCPDSSLDGARRSLLVSDIGLGVGVVGLAVGTYLWIRYVSHRPQDRTGGSLANATFRF